jgi:type VI secretion system secreted protein VgrG
MSLLSLADRPYILHTPFVGYELRIRSFTGEEAVSKLFRFQVVVESPCHMAIEHVLGQNVTFYMHVRRNHERRFAAKIRSVEELGTDEHGRTLYTLELVPRVWEFTQNVRSRIFMDATPVEIIESVFSGSGIGVDVHTQSKGKKRPYCVQYFESDFEFVVRLLEEEGWVYQCVTETDKVTFAIHGIPSSFPKVGPIPFHEVTGSDEERIGHWQKTRSLTATTHAARDHFFEAGNNPVLEGNSGASLSGAIPGWEKLGVPWQAEVNSYPGNWGHLFEEVSQSGESTPPAGYKEFGNKRTWSSLRQAAGSDSMSRGASNSVRIAPASVLEFAKHPTASGEYLIVSVSHKGSQAIDHSSDHVAGFSYENEFTVVPYADKMTYLPPRSTRKPVIYGCQTAEVLGADGHDEIWTDKYGRIHVGFWWAQEATKCSCWVRVATSWAGNNWGVQHIPRVGQEVVVTFLDGDPDRPLVVGSVYNPVQMPPFALPDHATQSGIRTRSTPSADPAGSNELRFEDKKGQEEIYLHAQRDRKSEILNDSKECVGNDCYEIVNGNLHAITGTDKFEQVNGSSNLTVNGACMTNVVKEAGINAAAIHLKAKSIVIEAEEISLRTGSDSQEFIRLTQGSGITIDSKGDKVWLNCGGSGSPEGGCYEKPKQPKNPFADTGQAK